MRSELPRLLLLLLLFSREISNLPESDFTGPKLKHFFSPERSLFGLFCSTWVESLLISFCVISKRGISALVVASALSSCWNAWLIFKLLLLLLRYCSASSNVIPWLRMRYTSTKTADWIGDDLLLNCPWSNGPEDSLSRGPPWWR